MKAALLGWEEGPVDQKRLARAVMRKPSLPRFYRAIDYQNQIKTRPTNLGRTNSGQIGPFSYYKTMPTGH
ncbi:MAG: hypothetical protein ACJAWY_002953 [Sphingomonas echinoides]|jgi:hypothetical protein